MFYIFRAVAGIGGGGVTNIAMIIVSDVVTLEERGKYQGFIGFSTGVGNVIGPFLAAAFISTTTWRAFFWLLSPLAIICAGITFYLLPSKPPQTTTREGLQRIDCWGVLTMSIGVVFLLIPVSGGGAYFSWHSPMVISMLVIGVFALIVFVMVEWKVSRLPMMPLTIFQSPVVTTILLQSFLLGAVYQSYLYYLPMYFQNARQYTVLKSAAMSVALVVLQSASSILSGQYISRYKRYGEVLWAGFGLWTLQTPVAVIVVALAIVGVGVGFVFQPTLVALQAHVPKARRAVITSNRNFFRCAGGACGLAVSAAVLQTTLRAHLPPQLSYLAKSPYAVQDVTATDIELVLDAYMSASNAVFILQVPLIGLCLIGCVLIKDKGLQRPEETKIDQATEESTGRTEDDGCASHMLNDQRKL
ncbi:hypothetical protein N0V93_000868 [Gnomoniopsis smithogilvyi]|uniref:Major facilitator superfamily (MFS) profile domain-containing protein n=1 Tax=Gnomoniopsis smithogilvyi TaxID=1191159 RepID=A0A9W9D0N1_9PEZI|nr:hypothetical protein N0V93_000868 [Gnomoniopsis smithogilvyi]